MAILRIWFKKGAPLRRALDKGYFIFALSGGDGQLLFFHIGIANLTTYNMTLITLAIDQDCDNQERAERCGNIAIRACSEQQVLLAVGDVWRKLGACSVPESFAALGLDSEWQVQPAIVALGDELRIPFHPCDVEIKYAGDSKPFWWSYSGVDDDEGGGDHAGAGDFARDETDVEAEGDIHREGGDSADGSDSAGTVNPADEDVAGGGKPVENRHGSREPAWRRRVQRRIARATAEEISHAVDEPALNPGYETGSDVDIVGPSGADVVDEAAPAAVAGRAIAPTQDTPDKLRKQTLMFKRTYAV